MIVEVYIDDYDFKPQDHFEFVVSLIQSLYSLLEPEHSKEYPMVEVEYLFPRIFKSESVIMRDQHISLVYYE